MIMHRDVFRGQSKGHVLVHDLFMLRIIGWLPEKAEYSELARQQSEQQPMNELDSAQLAFTSKSDPWAFPGSSFTSGGHLVRNVGYRARVNRRYMGRCLRHRRFEFLLSPALGAAEGRGLRDSELGRTRPELVEALGPKKGPQKPLAREVAINPLPEFLDLSHFLREDALNGEPKVWILLASPLITST